MSLPIGCCPFSHFLRKYCMHFLFYKLKFVMLIISYITMPAHTWRLYEVFLKLVQLVLKVIINMDAGPNYIYKTYFPVQISFLSNILQLHVLLSKLQFVDPSLHISLYHMSPTKHVAEFINIFSKIFLFLGNVQFENYFSYEKFC
jgi:hypothetical protein